MAGWSTKKKQRAAEVYRSSLILRAGVQLHHSGNTVRRSNSTQLIYSFIYSICFWILEFCSDALERLHISEISVLVHLFHVFSNNERLLLRKRVSFKYEPFFVLLFLSTKLFTRVSCLKKNMSCLCCFSFRLTILTSKFTIKKVKSCVYVFKKTAKQFENSSYRPLTFAVRLSEGPLTPRVGAPVPRSSQRCSHSDTNVSILRSSFAVKSPIFALRSSRQSRRRALFSQCCVTSVTSGMCTSPSCFSNRPSLTPPRASGRFLSH